jgi:hypothetical protein
VFPGRESLIFVLTAGFRSSREEKMVATLVAFREKYGSVEAYLKDELEMTEDDITKIRQNLLVRKV